MNQEEYSKWVDLVVNDDFIAPPKGLVEDYDSWKCKIYLSQYLFAPHREYEVALNLLESVLQEDLIAFNENEGISYQEYIEMKILALKTMGKLYSYVKDDLIKAYHYTVRALEIAEFLDYDFNIILRGEVWEQKLEYLRGIKGDKVVLDEIEDRINYHQENHPLSANSYMYNAYHFLADMERDKGNPQQRISYYKKALEYFPFNESDRAKLEEIWDKGQEDLHDTHTQMMLLKAKAHRYIEWEL